LTRPGNETFVLACLHEFAEGVVPGRVPFDWVWLKGNMKNILPYVEKFRKKLSDQDMIKFLRRERSFYFPLWGFSHLPFCKRSRDGTSGRFTSGVPKEGGGTRASVGCMKAVNEADDHE